MTEEEMKAMKLHETARVPGDYSVFIRRVPNGWIYEYYNFDGYLTAVVPVSEITITQEYVLPNK